MHSGSTDWPLLIFSLQYRGGSFIWKSTCVLQSELVQKRNSPTADVSFYQVWALIEYASIFWSWTHGQNQIFVTAKKKAANMHHLWSEVLGDYLLGRACHTRRGESLLRGQRTYWRWPTSRLLTALFVKVMGYRRKLVLEILERCGIVIAPAHAILTDMPHVGNISSWWIPRQLAADQMVVQVGICRQFEA